MSTLSSLSPKNQKELKSIGIYQIIGGGLGMIILLFSGVVFNLTATALIPALFYGFSVYTGIVCYELKNNSLNLTFVNQVLQVFSVKAGGFLFEYASGAALSLTLDTTHSLKIGFDFNLSTLSAGFFEGANSYYFGFNLFAFYIIYLTEKIRKELKAKMVSVRRENS